MPRILPANESVFANPRSTPLVCLSMRKGYTGPACIACYASRAVRPASNELTRWLDRKVWSTGSEVTSMTVAKNILWNAGASLLPVVLLSTTLAAQPTSAARYDSQIQTAVTQRLAAKKQFSDVKSSVDDGIVTLTGTVDLYQRKLEAAKAARKAARGQGVRNLVTVARPSG